MTKIENGALGYVTTVTEYDGRYGSKIDLGLGESPLGAAQELEEALANRNPYHDLAHYSKDPTHLKSAETLLKGIGLTNIPVESMVFNGNGSYGVGDEVVRYLSLIGYDPLYVPTYSFPNVKQWAIRHGTEYQPIPTQKLDPESALTSILEMPTNKFSRAIVYLDYPNNPSGYANPKLIREIIAVVSENGGMPILDMAFGEVLGDEFNQALQFSHDNGGISLASLTKTQGLAQVRLGYGILPDHLINNGYSGEQRLVFGVNAEAEFALQYLFKQRKDGSTLARHHADKVAQYNTQTNGKLYTELETIGLRVCSTDVRTPIQMVISSLSDFHQRLDRCGLVTESLHDYRGTLNGQIGYDHSAVRMLTPRPGEIDPTIERIKLALS